MDKNVSDLFGTITNPLNRYGGLDEDGLILFLTNILRLVFVAAGVYAFLNIIVAGFQFMNADGDSKAIATAWKRIWQSLVGLVLITGSFALAAVFGYLIFGDAGFILRPRVFGPGGE